MITAIAKKQGQEQVERYRQLMSEIKNSLVTLVTNLKIIRDEQLYEIDGFVTFPEFLRAKCPIADAALYLKTYDTFGNLKALDLVTENRDGVKQVLKDVDKKKLSGVEYNENEKKFIVRTHDDTPLLFEAYIKGNETTTSIPVSISQTQKAKNLINGLISTFGIKFSEIEEEIRKVELSDKEDVYGSINRLYTMMDFYKGEISDRYPEAIKKITNTPEVDTTLNRYQEDYVGKFLRCPVHVNGEGFKYYEGFTILVEYITKKQEYKAFCYDEDRGSAGYLIPVAHIMDYFVLLLDPESIKEAKKKFKQFKSIFRV